MSTAVDHERLLIEFFVLPQRRSRYLEFLSKSKNRNKVARELAHFKHLDPKRLVAIPPRQQHPREIRLLLMSLGAHDSCHVLSEDSEIDGKLLPLEEALKAVVGRGMGTCLSCVPGKLGYFEDEDQRWILQAKTAT